jgi:hypothetical protein
MATDHENLCDYADDERSLYKLWNEDLKRQMRKRQFSEFIGCATLLAALIASKIGRTDLVPGGILVGVAFLYAAIKYMIDESHVNYLLHQWDLREAIERVRREERQRQ